MANEKLFYKGKRLIDVCKEKGIKYVTVCYRIHHGMTIEEAVETPLKSNAKYFYKGENLFSYCKKNKIDYSVVNYRVRVGVDIETALITDKNIKANTILNKIDGHNKYTYNGKSLSTICKEKSIPYRTIQRRLQKGMSVEEALSVPVKFYKCSRRKNFYDTMKEKELEKSTDPADV